MQLPHVSPLWHYQCNKGTAHCALHRLRRAQQEVWRLEDERLRDKAWHQQEQRRMTKEVRRMRLGT